MPPKPRQVRMESKSALNAMQQLESRSDEELLKETRFKAAAQAILGTRAAERMDAEKAREHFRAAIAAARPQERLQLRRMAEASLALAERRAGRPEGRHREARRHAADQPSAADAARDGRDRAAQERRHAAPHRRHPARRPVRRPAARARLGRRAS